VVVYFTASGHELFTFSSKASFVGGRPDSFRVAEGEVFPVLKVHYSVIWYLFFGVHIHKYKGPSDITFNYTETVQSCCNKGGICREREINSLPNY
jgi:hypothetical protein